MGNEHPYIDLSSQTSFLLGSQKRKTHWQMWGGNPRGPHAPDNSVTPSALAHTASLPNFAPESTKTKVIKFSVSLTTKASNSQEASITWAVIP